ncbi:MAG: adenylate/guanylate cyclase domain-containing protein [Bdellovibrio sp.]|nr:MAG: adenylate/guanylate cyclase domain-containing protein [Bdellovibrio sp.]
MRLPISVKLIVVFVGFMVIATIIFAQQSSEHFAKVLVQREEFTNMSETNSKAVEVEQTIMNLIDRTQVLGQLLFKSVEAPLAQGNTSPPLSQEFLLNFDKEKFVASVEIWSTKNQELKLLYRKSKEKFLNDNKLNLDFFEQLRKQNNFPMASVSQKSLEIRNSSRPEGPALATLGFPLAKDAQDQVSHILLVDFSLALLQKSFATESERTQFLIDKEGRYLAHFEDQRVLGRMPATNSRLVEQAMTDQQPQRQIQFTDPEHKEVFIGAYVKLVNLGLIVLSQVSKSTVLEPAVNAKRQAFYIAGIVISLAIIMIFLFSMTLTGPIEILASLVAYVSKGNFDIRANDRIKFVFDDEVHDLANAFDSMTVGLKERDKMKNLFNKFHGSSITEDLLNSDIGVGGQNKDVTVFFSDIRGFTAFSENRTPEEVVAMLNEYFEVMVAIINRSGGVVDKFIGDAIMAVWGAPKGTPQDTSNAVRACLEMRKALEELNEKRKARDQVPIKIGMGLHTGHAISGTIGSLERMEYTVIGDTVNMTSRIEASTKAFGTDLLVSEAIIAKVGDGFLAEVAGEATVKGKSEPLKLYKVRGYKDPVTGQEVIVETAYSHFEKEHDEKVKASAA